MGASEYTTLQMLERLGAVVNRAHQVRTGVPAPMQTGDARHVCLSGIQTSISPLMLSYGAIERSHQTTKDIELRRLCGLKHGTNKELLDWFDTWAKLTILVFVHFRIESFFSNILVAMDPGYAERRFSRIASDLFDRLSLPGKLDALKALKAMTILRNSLHNNSNNRNENFDDVIAGKRFTFEVGKAAGASIFDVILLVDEALSIIEAVCASDVVRNLPTPIRDQFHFELGL